ncbi:MAG: XRE family transcriptional regulator [Angelakisella sp.]
MNTQVIQIANRIRELREVLEMSEEELSGQIGVCVEDYRRYEAAQTDIPVGVLYGIAAACQVDPTLLLTGLPPKMRSYTLVKQGDGVEVERYEGYRFRSLATNFINREMEPMIVNIDPTNGEPKEWFCHSGQEFNLVLSGRMKVILGEHELVLEEGDSLYFDPRVSHTQIAIDAPATFLTVINEQATAYGNATRLGATEYKEYKFVDKK